MNEQQLQKIQQVLNGAIGDLQKVSGNLHASRRINDKDELDRMVREHGICNVVGFLAELAADRVSDCEEDSQSGKDWMLAEEILSAARVGVDLRYHDDGDVNQRSIREKALSAFKAETEKVTT